MQNSRCYTIVKSLAPGAMDDLTDKIRGGLPAKAISDKLSKEIPLEIRQVISGAILYAGELVNGQST